MLEKPDLPEEKIIDGLLDEYALQVSRLDYLPLGVDVHTAVYRAVADDGTPYFVKLRGGTFDVTSVALPKFLSEQGIRQIIAPLQTQKGQLSAALGAYQVILYPYIEGRDGYEVALSERQWVAFGAALKSIHTAIVPDWLVRGIRRESYAAKAPQIVNAYLARPEDALPGDPVAAELAEFIRAQRRVILDLLGRAERLVGELKARSQELVVCHADLHAGNFLIDSSGDFYIVDWDDPILAPKERDLMYAGAGLMGGWRTPAEEETLFYQGYGPATVDQMALAYYRYERILADIAAFCEQIVSPDQGEADREQGLVYLKSNFLPGNTIDIACRSDRTQGAGVALL